MSELARLLGFVSLLVLPGAWITFALPGLDLPCWARVATAVALAPLVLCIEFYAVRLLGVSFEHTALVLIVVNLPASVWVIRRLRAVSAPDGGLVLGSTLALLVPLACLAPQLVDTQARIYSGHTWMHTDIVYMIANGDLLLDDPELVGIRLDYYWGGHIYQALLSYILYAAPVSSYIWTNVVMLLVVYAFLAGTVVELGGRRWAAIPSIIWLCFGLNSVGYGAGQLIRSQPWGDPRYTPWLFYFFFFHQVTIALGVFGAIVYLLVRRWPVGIPVSAQVVIALLLCTLGLIYPILLPAGVVVVLARIVAIGTSTSASRWSREMLGLAFAVLVACGLTAAQLHVLTRDRVVSSMSLHNLDNALHFGATSILANLPLLIGLAWTFTRYWRTHRNAMWILCGGGLASCVLYAVLDIRPGDVEYKFMFTAAVCFAPFPGLALEPLMERLGRRAVLAYAVITLALAAPFAHKIANQFPWGGPSWGFVYPLRPRADTASFTLRLADGEPSSKLFDAIRQQTPINSLLITEEAQLDLPAITRRRLYVPSVQDKAQPGVNVPTDHLLTVLRGYDPRILEERRRTLRALYEATDVAAALQQMLAFRRPLVLILDDQRHGRLREWLAEKSVGKLFYTGDGVGAWLINGRVS